MNWGIEKDEQGFHITDDSNFSDIAAVYEEKYAKLLSAAPELLEALQAITDLYDTDEGCRSLPEYVNAREAIKKALGE